MQGSEGVQEGLQALCVATEHGIAALVPNPVCSSLPALASYWHSPTHHAQRPAGSHWPLTARIWRAKPCRLRRLPRMPCTSSAVGGWRSEGRL